MTQEIWDLEAASFDDEPDHGLADPETRAAWRELLLGVLPEPPARIADLGCGTGTLTRLHVNLKSDKLHLQSRAKAVATARYNTEQAIRNTQYIRCVESPE